VLSERAWYYYWTESGLFLSGRVTMRVAITQCMHAAVIADRVTGAVQLRETSTGVQCACRVRGVTSAKHRSVGSNVRMPASSSR